MPVTGKFRRDSIYTMNNWEKQLYEKLKLEKLKRREHFRVKLDSIDNDFNKWLEEKELSEEFKNNVLSERPKYIENVNKRIEKIWKNNIQFKRNAFKKDKEELQKRSNATSQPSSSTKPTQNQNQRYHPQVAIIQRKMKIMINLTTSRQKTSSATIINLTKKDITAKNHQLIILCIIKIAIIATK